MLCPTCAEKINWWRALGRSECPHCRLPLRFAPDGAPINLGVEQVRFLLEMPRTQSDNVLLIVGAVITGLISAFPSAGLLTGVLLPLIQVFCIDRSTRRFREHFNFLHGLSHDIVSGLLFVALVALEGAAGAFLGSIAVVVNVPVFLAFWWIARALAKNHLRQIAEGRGPHPIEIGMLIFAMVLLIGPPIFVAATLLAGVVGGSSELGAGTISPAEFLKVMGTGAVLSLDLFVLPLWVAVGLVTFGFADVPASTWIGSWWIFGLVTVALGAEVILDNGLDRRMRFSRTTWPRIQFLLTPVTLLTVVLILGQNLSWWGKGLAFMGAVSLSGLIRFGGTETVKTAISMLPGALAQRKALLYTAPLRIAGALAAAYFAHRWPVVVAIALSALALVTSTVLVAHSLVRWRARKARRITCSTCGYRAHEGARICPNCHEPVMSSRILSYPLDLRQALIEVGTAVAWADGTMKTEEARILSSSLHASELPEATVAELEEHLHRGLAVDDIAFENIAPRHHDQILGFATTMATADQLVSEEEREIWRQIVTRLHGKESPIARLRCRFRQTVQGIRKSGS